jgi:hypothetical protein
MRIEEFIQSLTSLIASVRTEQHLRPLDWEENVACALYFGKQFQSGDDIAR